MVTSEMGIVRRRLGLVRVGLEMSYGIHFTPTIDATHNIASCPVNVYIGVLVSVAVMSKWGGDCFALAASMVQCPACTTSWATKLWLWLECPECTLHNSRDPDGELKPSVVET